MERLSSRQKVLVLVLVGELLILGLGFLIFSARSRPERGETTVQHSALELPLVARMQVRDRTPRSAHPAKEIDAASLDAAIRAVVSGQETFELPAVNQEIDRTSRRRTYRLSVDVYFSRVLSGGLAKIGYDNASRVRVAMEMDRVAGGHGLEAYAAESVSEGQGLSSDAEQSGEGPEQSNEQALLILAARTAAQAFHDITVQFTAREKSNAALMADLAGDDRAKRVAALRQLGRRRAGEALDSIQLLLDDPHQDVVLAAVGALTNLRDPRATSVLVASTRGRSSQYLGHVVSALKVLGGYEAEAFLDTLASGHEDAELRARARDALQSLRGMSSLR